MILKCNIPQHNNNNKQRLHLPELGRRCRYTHSRIAAYYLRAFGALLYWLAGSWGGPRRWRPKLCICFQLTAFMHIIIQCAHMYSLTRFMLLQSTSPHNVQPVRIFTCRGIYRERSLDVRCCHCCCSWYPQSYAIPSLLYPYPLE